MQKAAGDKDWELLEKIASSANDQSFEHQERSFCKHKKAQKTVHFATLMDICDLKNAELEPKFQKYKGSVLLRGDTVKDDSGSYALFTEQGSSASQMTAVKNMDVVARQPGCAGQAADAVSAYLHPSQKWRMLPNY